ncbi:MAG: polysaccharide deacetylase family protein, partial [bacterium]|nr:polysaccharide deacetylase family protein [bacterium]
FKMLAWHEIKEMHGSGLIDFEPHGVKHQKLGKIPLKEAEQEIIESKKIIEERLGKECRFFSYPYGNYNKDVIEILKRNGFLAGLTVKKEFVKPGTNLMEIPRNFVYHDCSKAEFKGIAGLSPIIL